MDEKKARERIIAIINKSMRRSGFSEEFIKSIEHTSIYDLETRLSIGHYKLLPHYEYRTLKCGCRVAYPVWNFRESDY